MANSKLKCRQCGERFDRVGMLQINGGNFCSFDHAAEYGRAKALKTRQAEFRKKTATMKREHNESDLKVRKNAARKACHDYIKARDLGKPCICCSESLGDVFHAGHWHPSNMNPFIRYHEDNIHGQRVDCNYFKGGDSGSYAKNLIEKIGQERFDWLEENKSKPIKRTAEDYKEIEQYYKNKLKQLTGDL